MAHRVCVDLFRSLEDRLDQQAADAGERDAVIRAYGISMTTLEEVFVRIG